MTGVAAAMTIAVDYGYDAVTAATLTARERFDGAVVIGSDWEVMPVMRLLELERRCQAPNWDGHNSPALDRRTSALALGLIRQIGTFDIDSLPQPYLGAVAAGGVSFEFQSGQRELALTIFNDAGTISYLKSNDGEPFEEGEVHFASPARLRELLTWLTSAPA